MSDEIQQEINRCLEQECLIESIKNTIVGILNTDEDHHHDMAEYCLTGLAVIEDKHKADMLALLDEVENSLDGSDKLDDTYIHVEIAYEEINKIKQRIGGEP